MTSLKFLACLMLLAKLSFFAHASLLGDEQCKTCQCRCEEQCRRESNDYGIDDGYDSDDDNNHLEDSMSPIQGADSPEYEPELGSEPIPVAHSRRPQSCEQCARQNFDILNDYRQSRGLRRLIWNDHLGHSAAKHSKEMYRRLSLYHSRHHGWENVAFSFGRSSWQSIAQSMFNQWRKSPGHDRNMLSRQITCGGVGVYGDGERFYGTQMFLARC